MAVTKDWESGNSAKDNINVTQEWDSSTVKRQTAADRLRESAGKFRQRVAESHRQAKERRAYERSPEGRKAAIKKIRAEIGYERARSQLASTRAKRRKAQMAGLGIFSQAPQGSVTLGSMFTQPQSFSGMDSMLGFGSSQTRPVRRSSVPSPRKSGLDEMFGL
jgi:hypothetical protein